MKRIPPLVVGAWLMLRIASTAAFTVHSMPSCPSISRSSSRCVVAVESASAEEKENDSELMQAKLLILEDVVSHLNMSHCQDQTELARLQSHLQTLESQVSQQEHDRDQLKQLHKQQLEAQVTVHEQAQLQLERKLQAQFQLECDEVRQSLRKDTKAWKSQREAEWQESLEIAGAAVTAAETREQALLDKLDHLEVRYHQEAAQYKMELDALQAAWKLENSKLAEEVTQLHKELKDAKQKRDQETTFLVEELGLANQQLEAKVSALTDELKVQKRHHEAQVQFTQDAMQIQREKQRKFYTEAIRLLQQEKAMKELELAQLQQGGFSFWKRLFRLGRGSDKSRKRKTII
jgi:outer membrane murein-binding lipoprotein Lpp